MRYDGMIKVETSSSTESQPIYHNINTILYMNLVSKDN